MAIHYSGYIFLPWYIHLINVFCVYIFIDYIFLLNSGLSFSKIA
ncbi:putative membrane protein [Escherichia coli p0305293.14]|uniref:Uncharacterized protein n=1 Tax=Escherichia coli MS 85-1 TaxID=679202 RepID=A0AAN3M9L7_ECOLX|nr:hypothetical protein EcB7A_3051 [Escherichia coli B7A]EDV83545.1 hypothetical protein EcE22_5480 [Escherichia coli E22]EDX30245.1 hypothetical protein EcB171_4487 [Escherichia coli B171]EFJ84074.1 hypothetical protein HMPREF9536_05686 [Escherichia coli MS 84-1]EFK00032.1 hypothetical protein HMPREF9548_05274 [Escherichia coli MS 182-1]EFK45503.1 hypothetical protein HMPREF9346_02943 [Escherichia coli MS 119-7]EFK50641.1 hypothetical protein HMPREF9345_02962 [Escherichia coli MS 107-1]EFK7